FSSDWGSGLCSSDLKMAVPLDVGRRDGAIAASKRDPRLLAHDADASERDAERVLELARDGLYGAGRRDEAQLVILTAAERERQPSFPAGDVDGYPVRGDLRLIEEDPDPAGGGEVRGVADEAVGEVEHGAGQIALGEPERLPDPRPRAGERFPGPCRRLLAGGPAPHCGRGGAERAGDPDLVARAGAGAEHRALHAAEND